MPAINSVFEDIAENLTPRANGGLISEDDGVMDVLPNFKNVHMPIEKLTEYSLNPDKDHGKAEAFRSGWDTIWIMSTGLLKISVKIFVTFQQYQKGITVLARFMSVS